MPTIAETRQELVHLVLPEHANLHGNLFGGRLMHWIASAATLPAIRLARATVLMGSMDDLDFLAPVRVGDLLLFHSQVEFVGRSSMEVGVEVEVEHPHTGQRRRATSAHVAMVAVDEEGGPRPVGAHIHPRDAAEEAVVEEARARKAARDRRLAGRGVKAEEVERAGAGLRHTIEVARIVFPDDAVYGNRMFAGSLLLAVDEVASILAVRYARGSVVTASVDALDFYAPILLGNIVIYQAAINHVGRTSVEVGVRVLAEDPQQGTRRHACTTYLTAVHVGPDGRPAPLPPLRPVTPEERRRWEAAEARRALRQRRRAALS